MKFFKGKNKPIKTEKAEPRDLNSISKEYTEIAARAGALQYQILVLKQDLDLINDKMKSLNLEGSERAKLDSELKAREAKPEEKEQSNEATAQ